MSQEKSTFSISVVHGLDNKSLYYSFTTMSQRLLILVLYYDVSNKPFTRSELQCLNKQLLYNFCATTLHTIPLLALHYNVSKQNPFPTSVLQWLRTKIPLLVLYSNVSKQNPFTSYVLQCLKQIPLPFLYYTVSKQRSLY